MKIIKKTMFKTLLITTSVLILIIPDILFNDHKQIIDFCLSIISKAALFLFLGLIVLRLTRSYFWAYLIVGIPYLISSIVEISSLVILDHYITADNLGSLFNASKSEIREFTSGFGVYFIIPIILIIVYFFILTMYKRITYDAKNQKRIIPLALILFIISFSFSTFKILRSEKVYAGRSITNYVFKANYLGEHPFNILNESYVLGKIRYRIHKYKKQHDNFKFGILNPADTTRPQIVIFIIGERMRYSNWSINGYKKETSPNLEKVKNLISFNKNYSNSNYTYGSIPLIITQATPLDPYIAYSQKSLISLFKEAGYETSWISSQYLFDIVDEKKVPDHVYELYKKLHTDADIIPLFDSVINKRSAKNQLIVINMLGGHGGNPARFNVFKPNNSLENYPVTMKNAPIFINTYDNTILLQDYVISEIIKETERQNVRSVLMFTADHGCNLFDNGKALFGYGSAHPTEKETHVPLFISLSDKFIESNPYKYKNLLAHKNLLTTNNNLFYTLADLANIKYKSYIKKESISDSSYVEPLSRYVFVNGAALEYKK